MDPCPSYNPQGTLRGRKWQARRDSNPQPTDLESVALPIRATGLERNPSCRVRSTALFDLILSVHSVHPTKRTILAEFQFFRGIPLILISRIVSSPALIAGKTQELTHSTPRGLEGFHSKILATTPAPTVRPPSRIANRSPSSMAMGAIRLTSRVTLSPGITISVPSGRLQVPVTSVVRK